MGVILGILMFLNIGPHSDIVKTFKKEDVKHMSQFVDGPILIRAEGKTIVMDKKSFLGYLELVFKNSVVSNVKMSRPLKSKLHFLYVDQNKYRKNRLFMVEMYLTDLNDSHTLSNTIFFDIYKRKIVEVLL